MQNPSVRALLLNILLYSGCMALGNCWYLVNGTEMRYSAAQGFRYPSTMVSWSTFISFCHYRFLPFCFDVWPGS